MSKRALSTGGNVKESLKWEVFVAPGNNAGHLALRTHPKLFVWR